jgi:hypothetical protein
VPVGIGPFVAAVTEGHHLYENLCRYARVQSVENAKIKVNSQDTAKNHQGKRRIVERAGRSAGRKGGNGTSL